MNWYRSSFSWWKTISIFLIITCIECEFDCNSYSLDNKRGFLSFFVHCNSIQRKTLTTINWILYPTIICDTKWSCCEKIFNFSFCLLFFVVLFQLNYMNIFFILWFVYVRKKTRINQWQLCVAQNKKKFFKGV